jgi:hypothetical protein
MLAYFETSLGWAELLRRTVKETQADKGFGLAAQLAYYFFLALFPALLFLIALAGVFADAGLVERLVNMMSGAGTARRCLDRSRSVDQDLAGRSGRNTDVRRPRSTVEQLGGDGVAH